MYVKFINYLTVDSSPNHQSAVDPIFEVLGKLFDNLISNGSHVVALIISVEKIFKNLSRDHYMRVSF
jgi:hypothetical protein